MTETQGDYITLEQRPPYLTSFLTFTRSFDHEKAKQRFFEKYGQKPKECFPYKRNLYVGPIPERNNENGL